MREDSVLNDGFWRRGILGAHILGPHAEEVINIFSIAIGLGLTAKHLNDPILCAYPTNSSDVVYML